jgi:hypothetical protein
VSGSIINLKRGASLLLNLNFTNPDGTPTVLTGFTLEAQLRDAEERLVATLTPVATATPGLATIDVVDTSPWPEGLLRIDACAINAGIAQVFSPTYGIQLLHAETELLPPLAPYNPVTDQ